MATEQIPAIPDLRARRLAYARAIAASQAAEERYDAAQARRDAHTVERALRAVLARACYAEQQAGRAYLVALAEADPACRVCGCTQECPCVSAGHVSCYWVAPDLCSACVGKEEA